ncbi:hypothetical protein F5Y03DRAFT_399427 [Xylaria venustula]|nr:hypothetical protein F5Y03DRAFT_399427 [Xylaria venustula]
MPRDMDYKSQQRIVRAMGPDHPFSRRAELTVRNGMNQSNEARGNSSDQPKAGEEKKGEAKADNGQSQSGK